MKSRKKSRAKTAQEAVATKEQVADDVNAERQVHLLEARLRALKRELAVLQGLRAGNPLFSEVQVAALKHTLGSSFERALPGLEEAVSGYHSSPKKTYVLQEEVRAASVKRLVARTTRSAGELEKAAGLLASALKESEPLIQEAFLMGNFQLSTMADLAFPNVPEGRWTRLQAFLSQTQHSAALLEKAAREWRVHEREKGKMRRGPRPKMPLAIAGYVGYTLARAGVELSRGKSGRWAKVTRVVYRAAGLEPPKFIERLLSMEYQFLAQRIPRTLMRLPLR